VQLTVGVPDVVNLGKSQALGGSSAAPELHNVGHGLERDKTRRRAGGVPVLSDPQLAALLVLELDLQDAVDLHAACQHL